MLLLGQQTYTPLSFITILGAMAGAGIFLFLGAVPLGFTITGADIGNYLSPDFPERARIENIVASMTLIVCSGILVYSILRPWIGGVLLCAYAVVFGFVFNAFKLSTLLYPSRGARFFPSWSIVTLLILLLGVLCLIQSRRSTKETG